MTMVPKFGKDSEQMETPSNNLWVGNLPGETVDSDLIELFGNYGQIDNVTTYSARSFAFVHFKSVENAKAAKKALQGATLHGSQIKIEFARPAKPCKSLWVGGVSPSVSKEELEEEFLKFGKIEDFRFLRERNTAYVEYVRLEDASLAIRNINGKRIGGDQIRVDFLRSQPSRREQWPSSHESRDGSFSGRVTDSYSPGAKRLYPQLGGRKGDGQPSKVLWVGYPPSVQIDEQMLHNAMILFGEIERIKSFPTRHYSFVEFRSVEEARRAKEGLQGRLFNDPRITIMYSSSELAPGKEYPGFHSGAKGPGPDVFFNEHSFRPSQMDVLGPNHSVIQSTPIPGSSILGQPIRPLGQQGSIEPLLPGSEYPDIAPLGPNWRRPSPTLPSPAQGIRPKMRQASGSWDVYDATEMQRDAKRSRIEASPPVDETAFPLRKIDDLGLGLERPYRLGPLIDRGAAGLFMNVQGKNRPSPGTDGGHLPVYPDDDYIWRGIIAKGGTPVCHARCIQFGKDLETELPEVVNCSARTGLDMLAKHFAEAIGFDIVFFLPDSEDDFASYTEFLHYLGSKNRAGVAKFDDGTTMFLVPPSDFLTKVLKVMGPERLYGVVLKLPPQLPSTASVHQHQLLTSRANYSLPPSKEEQASQMEYGRVMPEEPKPPQRSLGQSPLQNHLSSSAPVVPQSGVSLTPELIATLTSLLPATSQPSSFAGSQSLAVSSTGQTSVVQTVAHGRVVSQGWNQDQLASEPVTHSLQQFGSHFSSISQAPQLQQYSSQLGIPSHSSQMLHGHSQFQEATVSTHQAIATSRAFSNFSVPPQNVHVAVSSTVGLLYQPEVPPNIQKGYGMMHGTDASALYGSSTFQQSNDPNAMSNHVQGVNIPQRQNLMQPSADRVSTELPNQVQHLQSVLSGAGQGPSDGELDKNQRYQSTLQFAANLLLQIQQQQQQQTNNPGGQGAGGQP